MKGYFGVDVGGTGTRVNLYVSPDGTKPISTGLEILTDQDYDRAMANAAGLVIELGRQNGITSYSVGVALAARLNNSCDTILSAGSLPTWVGHNFIETLSGLLPAGAIVIGDNDAAAQALAEAKARAKREPSLTDVPFIYLAFGTGIGTALLHWEDGKPVAYPSEAQHIQLQLRTRLDNPVPCGCKQRNCVEAVASGRAAGEIFGWNASELQKHEFRALVRNQALLIVSLLACHPYITTVVVGGGLPAREPAMLKTLQRYVDQWCIAGMIGTIQPTLFPEGVGTLGGLALLTSAA